jgi:hypothetical protein
MKLLDQCELETFIIAWSGLEVRFESKGTAGRVILDRWKLKSPSQRPRKTLFRR